jgi:hypothetical protein
MFFVFDYDGHRRIGEFKTRAAANEYVQKLRSKVVSTRNQGRRARGRGAAPSLIGLGFSTADKNTLTGLPARTNMKRPAPWER